MRRILNALLFWGGFVGGSVLAYRKFGVVAQKVILGLSSSDSARQLITSSPMTKSAVDRFVAGDTLDDALRAAKSLNDAGLLVSLDYLGESVQYSHEAIAAREQIMAMIDAVEASDSEANLSIKLTQLGLKLSPELAFDNLSEILKRAREKGLWIRIDMEESAVAQLTIETYLRVRHAGFDNVGIVVQSYLYRTAADVEKLIEVGARVRLCKGAYDESAEVAFPIKADTDANFIRLMEMLLSPEARANGVRPAFATHDNNMIQAVIDYAKTNRVPKDAFEFQMLYGVRRDLQDHLASLGYPVRVYVPFGDAWYPYLMRRMAERPANLQFMLSNMV